MTIETVSDYVICEKCGTENNGDATQCSLCGKTLSTAVPSASGATPEVSSNDAMTNCPICEQPRKSEDTICQSCGEEFSSFAISETESVPEAEPTEAKADEKNCPTCGQAREKDDILCQSCGEEFVKTAPPEQETYTATHQQEAAPALPEQQIIKDKPCPACAQLNVKTATRCELCGELLAEKAKKKPKPKPIANYPVFQRSPRIVNSFCPVRIDVQQPPQINEKPQINWFAVILPPIIMVGVSVLAMVLSDGGLATMLFMIPMTVVTLLTTIVSYISQRSKWKKQKAKQSNAYYEYLAQLNNDIGNLYHMQLSAAITANPDTSFCHDIVVNRMRRLWERSCNDSDFITVRLGRGELPLSSEIALPPTNIGDDVNPFIIEAQKLKDRFAVVRDIAIILPVKDVCTVGFIGARDKAITTVSNSIVQLATHHSYTDLKIILLASEKELEQFAWARWLPHVWDNTRTARFISSTKARAAELLEHFESVLQQRLDVIVNDGNNDLILPYLLFVVTNPAIIGSSKVLKLLSMNNPSMGVGAFLMFDSMDKLPKECKYIVELGDYGGSMYAKSDSANKQAFTLDSFYSYDGFARSMAPIRDNCAVQGSLIPASVTFFKGFGIGQAEEIDVSRNWMVSNSHKTLATKIGTGENGKPFMFDIHEKKHGPHGLVAGTTGSGKSEVLQTWILSMCISYPPQDVSFVIIDFKGGGLAYTLSALPHVAGVVSDIDTNIQRKLISLESELDRRKKLFASVSSPSSKIVDINEYQKAHQLGRVSEPLSHLIVVVDEFTELKTKFPDFMTAVDKASRTGRSLGIHLVLATQRPDGAVTDEMKDNSDFRWCLRMADDSASKAVIDRTEAATIGKQFPGRTYIQVKNSGVFELVQVYYSGASINKDGDDERIVEVSFVDSVGRRDTVSSRNHFSNNEHDKELMALINHITDAHRASGLPRARKIWEDALPERLCLDDVTSQRKSDSLVAIIGITDDPRRQSSHPTEIDFTTDGHIIIYGAPGTGKTVLLQTLMMSLAERYTPDEVNAYIMDFGSWSMKNLEALPHIGGVANGNEDEKIVNLMKLLADTLNERKTLFAQVSASNLESYRQASKTAMPAIVVIVDNFAPIREMYSDIESSFVKLARDGSGYGIYLVITATSLSGNISFNLSQNFKQALSLRMTEKADYRDIVGDTEGLEPAKVAGRGLIRGKPPMEFQTALAVAASDDVEYVSNIKQRCLQIASEWHGELPREIPVMPDIVLPVHIKSCPPGCVAIGLSVDDILPICVKADNRVVLISGTELSGKTNMLRLFAKHFRGGQGDTYVVSTRNDEDADERISEAIHKAVDGGHVNLVIDDIIGWLSHVSYDETDLLENLIVGIKHNRFTMFAAGDASDISSSSHSVIQKMVASGVSILLGGCFCDHYSQFEASNIGYTQQNEQLAPHCGYLIQKRKGVAFKAVFIGDG